MMGNVLYLGLLRLIKDLTLCTLEVLMILNLNAFNRLFALKMNWNVILPSSLGMPMQRYISVKMIDALDRCATSKI